MDSKTGKEEKVASNEEDRTNSEVASVRRVVIKRKENSSSFWGFSFCGGNTNGLFVSKVMPNLNDFLAEGDKILQVNGIPLDGATFEEFFIYLKCYAQTYLTIEVEACPDLFRIAAEMNERDNFCIRSLKSSKLLQQQLLAPGDNSNGLYLDFEAGDILCVTDSLYRGYFGHWLAQVANPNPTRVNSGLFHEPCTSGASYDDKLKLSGLIPSCYLNLGDIQNQLSQSFKNQSDISKTNADDNEEERRSSFRKFVSKISLFTSGHSHSKSNAYFSSNEEEPLNIQSCSFFEYVKPFNNEGFQRPVLFVGVYADLFVQYLAGHVTAHFKLFDQSATDYFKQSSLEAENWLEASSYSVRSSVTKYEMKALRKLCSTCAKGVHPILAGDLLKLKVLIDNELQPLVFFFDPKLSPKTLRDVYTSLKNDGNLSSKMVKNLLDYGERTKRDLKKLKYFCVSLRGPLVMAIKELMKQLEPRSPFVTFAASAPSQLGLEVAKLAVH